MRFLQRCNQFENDIVSQNVPPYIHAKEASYTGKNIFATKPWTYHYFLVMDTSLDMLLPVVCLVEQFADAIIGQLVKSEDQNTIFIRIEAPGARNQM